MKDLLCVLGAVALVALSGFVGYRIGVPASPLSGDTVRVTVTDTLRCFVPVAKDSVVVRYVKRVLPVATAHVAQSTERGVGSEESGEVAVVDSAVVELAITQREFSDDSTYRAWVSGYEPRLDSILVYRERVKETVSFPVEVKRTRRPRVGFGLSCGLGYGILHKDADVFLGGGIVVTF